MNVENAEKAGQLAEDQSQESIAGVEVETTAEENASTAEEVKPGASDSAALETNTEASSPDFEELSEPSLRSAPARSVLGHRTIIKNARLRVGNPSRISTDVLIATDPESVSGEEAEEMEITPLYDKDSVVGLAIKCRCGAAHEVRFEFPQTASAGSEMPKTGSEEPE